MKKLINGLTAVAMAVTLSTAVAAPAFAAENAAANGNKNKNCDISTEQPDRGTAMVDPVGGKKKFTKDGNRAYIKVTLSGKGCEQDVTLAAWKAPDADFKPYRKQVLAWYNNRTIKTGNKASETVTMSIRIPDCYFQIDLVRGSNPRGIDGGGAYQEGRMIHGIKGGDKTCEVPETPETPDTPDTPVTPETPDTPDTPVTPEQPKVITVSSAKELPKTGPAAVTAAFGAASAAGAAGYNLYLRRRK